VSGVRTIPTPWALTEQQDQKEKENVKDKREKRNQYSKEERRKTKSNEGIVL
jgi:hypothetical protein